MASNRKAFEAYVLDFMGEVTKGGGNKVIYERLFKALNNEQLEALVVKMEQGMPLSIWVSNWNRKEMIEYERILRLSKKYGVVIEQQLIVYDADTGIKSMTPHTAITGLVRFRKQRQMQVTKFGAAANDYSIDDLTGQVMGDSRSTGISQPEITVLRNLGLDIMANELYNVKGGDLDALKHYKNELLTTGKTNTNASLQRGTIAKVLSSVYHLFRGRHLDSNFNKRLG
ncbi:hypothetical protein D3C79_48420 [compost metagenome]